MKFKKGQTHHIKSYPGKRPYKIHICAIVDGDMIVYKYFGHVKQWWHYEIKSDYLLGCDIERCKT